MKYLFICLTVALTASAGMITPRLVDQMETARADAMIDIFVKPAGDVDCGYVAQATAGFSRADRREFAVSVMKAVAEQTQAPILESLKAWPSESVTGLHTNWLANFISCSATVDAIRDMASLECVAWVDFRPATCPFIEPIDVRPANPDELSRANAWGVDKIGAPAVWALGYDGEGIVVAVIDTGVNYNHLDLRTHMWHDTPANLHYGWDMASGDGDPMDESGHGTHCAGSVASDGTAGTVCGVAPGATIMAVRVLTSVSPDAEVNVMDGFQWAVDHGADVLSTSLGYIPAWNPQRALWRTAEETILAAGVPHSIAAGNEGPGSATLRTPGDCPPPWRHPDQVAPGAPSACICVGATTSSDAIASFSSHGPANWETIAPWYDYDDTPPNAGLLRPDVCAPGEDVLSCNYQNTSGYTTKSGTSMATPHNAGLMALMLHADAASTLTPALIDEILETTALDLGTSGKDNTYGAGRIQALQAVQAVIYHGIGGGSGSSSMTTPSLLLSSAMPNPVSTTCAFSLYMAEPGAVNLSVYDIHGRKIALVTEGEMGSGNHTIEFVVPYGLGNGVYFLRASGCGSSATSRFTVIK
ncbi:MAG: S8 family serine peptidase [Candidatus Fermentibacter daniensis]